DRARVADDRPDSPPGPSSLERSRTATPARGRHAGISSALPFAEVLAEKLYRAPPGVGGGLRVVNFGARVVEEGVVCAGVDVHLDPLAVLLQFRFQPAHRVGRHGLILLREEAEHGRAQML